MTRLTRIVAGIIVAMAVGLPVAGSASAVTAGSVHMVPMGENGCC